MGHSSFLNNISIPLIDKSMVRTPKRETLPEKNFENLLTFWS